jgi:hypothetical protein
VAPALIAALKHETQGEQLLWSGQESPARAFLVTTSAWLLGIPWLALAGFMEFTLVAGLIKGWPGPAASSWQVFAMLGAVLFVGLFVVIGIVMVAAPFTSWLKARRSLHFVTNQRFGSLALTRGRSVVSHPVHRIVRTERHERRDGTGTLTIVTGFRTDSDGDSVEQRVTLRGVADVRRLERIINEQAGLLRSAVGTTAGSARA